MQIPASVFTPRKRFGQNFLRSAGVLQRIIQSLALCNQDHVVEIGPGLGALTEHLLAFLPTLSAVEIDRDLVEILKQRWPSKLQVYSEDALQFDFERLALQQQGLLRIVGNLPYNIATPLLFYLMSSAHYIQDIHIMVQKEVAERLVATVGSHSYSRLSVMIQYHCHAQLLFKVPPGAFWPMPKVHSAFVRLTPYTGSYPPPLSTQGSRLHPIAQNFHCFEAVVKKAFNQRRKTLRNALRELVAPTQWEGLGINSEYRPEQISVAEYIKIANSL